TRSKRDWSSDVCSSDLEAGPHRLAVEHYRAGAADAVLATDVGPGEAQLVAQPIDERQPRGHLRLAQLSVDFDRDLVQGLAHWTRSEERRVGKEGRAGW